MSKRAWVSRSASRAAKKLICAASRSQFQRFGKQPVIGDAVRDQAHPLRLLAIDRTGAQGKIHRPLRPDQARQQPAGAAVRPQADIDEAELEAGRRRRKHDVAGNGDGRTRAERHAVDRRDDQNIADSKQKEVNPSMNQAYICDAIRTPIGRFGGALASVRPDDLAAHVIRSLMTRNPGVDWDMVDDVIMGCANQAGEDNRNVARMAALLAGLPHEVGGSTVNRLCGSGLDAVGTAARAIRSGDAGLIIAGGVESMSRAPFVMPKAESAFSRHAEIHDTTIGWRFVNPAMRATYGVDSMPETAENVAADHAIAREDQDAFALRSQQRTAIAQENGRLAAEIVSLAIPQRKGEPVLVTRDEHPRSTTITALAALRPAVRPSGTVTAGNASGVNDGAAALIVASEAMITRYGLQPRARIMGMASAGVLPRVMGIGPVPASQKLLRHHDLTTDDLAVIELNEAFAAQGLAVLRGLGIADDDARVNPNGGAIALGHPLGMSGARLALTATAELAANGGRYALVTMCVGVGQGISMLLERV